LSHEAIAERVGLERSTVTNLLRLLKLTPEVRQHVVSGALSMGQARALVGIESAEDQRGLAEQAIRHQWSVRQVEAAVRRLAAGPAAPAASPSNPGRPPYLDDLERQIGEQLGTKVQIKTRRKKGAGTLSVEFYSIDQFDELLAKLGVKTS
ncbi:MAG: chromosome partitioning protein ParB, partial [Planctomycetota bacterium]